MAKATMIDANIDLEKIKNNNINKGRTVSIYWDDNTADEELVNKIIDPSSNFYKVTNSSNHKNASNYTNRADKVAVLAAYDGDLIEDTNQRKTFTERNHHAYMTTVDLYYGGVEYSRSSLLSSGLTQDNVNWSNNNTVGVSYKAIGTDGKEHLYNYFTDEQA